MALDKAILEEAIYKSPLALLSIKDKNDIAFINELLPYSIGFEIEGGLKKEFIGKEEFRNILFGEIPFIISYDVNNYESKFRIPPGIKGLICLYLICEQYKMIAELNEGSGIHFHVDMLDCFYVIEDALKREKFAKDNETWVLEELDSWNYKGTYNGRKFRSEKGGWIGLRSSYRTAEIRICEMSFDYNVLLKRFIHGSSIVRRLKVALVGKNIVDNIVNSLDTSPLDIDLVVKFIKTHSSNPVHNNLNKLRLVKEHVQEQLKALNTKPVEVTVDMKTVVQSRVKKFI